MCLKEVKMQKKDGNKNMKNMIYFLHANHFFFFSFEFRVKIVLDMFLWDSLIWYHIYIVLCTEWVNLTLSVAAGSVSSARQSPANADQWTQAQGQWLQDVRWNVGDVADY